MGGNHKTKKPVPFAVVPWEPGRKSPGAVGAGRGDWPAPPATGPRCSLQVLRAPLPSRQGPEGEKACFASEEGGLEANLVAGRARQEPQQHSHPEDLFFKLGVINPDLPAHGPRQLTPGISAFLRHRLEWISQNQNPVPLEPWPSAGRIPKT